MSPKFRLPDRAQAPVVALIGLAVALVLVNGRAQISNDTWFNLVTGREIAWSGLIHRNTLTLLRRGAEITDPQWLAHLFFYALHRLGGFAALLVVRAMLSAATLAVACTASIRLGATPGRTAIAGLAVLPLVTTNAAVRAQSLGELCFVSVTALLLADQREVSRRTWWAVAIVALWTNLHGSALFVTILGPLVFASRLIEARRGRSPTPPAWRDIALGFALVIALFASPYVTSLVPYFRASVASRALAIYNEEYRRPTLVENPLVFAVAAILLACVARARRQLATFEIGLAFVVVALGLSAIRYGVFLALGSMLVLPRALDAVLPAPLLAFDRARGASPVAAGFVAAAVASAVFAVVTVPNAIAKARPASTAADISRRAGSDGAVFATENYGDTLLWYRPELRGRVALDARLEFLALRDLAWDAAVQRGETVDGLDAYRIVVVDKADAPALARRLRESRDWHVVNEDPTVIVFASSSTSAAAARRGPMHVAIAAPLRYVDRDEFLR